MKRIIGYAVVLSVLVVAVWIVSWTQSGGEGQGQEQPNCLLLCGDANNDGCLDISDPVYTLGFLFLGSPPPQCLAACDPPITNLCEEIKGIKEQLSCIFCAANGNVGIGTGTPRTRLEVAGELTLKGTDTSLYLGHRGPWVGGGSTAEDLLLGANGSGLGIYFAVNGRAPTAVIDSSGNVGIGTTTPGHPLEMASGAHVTAGGVWTNSSSRELKEGIRDLGCQEACQALEELQPWKFRYKVDPADEHVGFIAEEVPELVATPDRKGLAPMDVVAVVVKVVQEQQRLVQEQQRLVQEQQRTIRALEDRLKALEARVK
jgi:hypothetical protein